MNCLRPVLAAAVAACQLAGCGGAAERTAVAPKAQSFRAAAAGACVQARQGTVTPPPASASDVPAYARAQALTVQRTLSALGALPGSARERAALEPLFAAYGQALGLYARVSGRRATAVSTQALAAAEQTVAAAATQTELPMCSPLPA